MPGIIWSNPSAIIDRGGEPHLHLCGDHRAPRRCRGVASADAPT
jgi:hypothetical protein